MVLVEDALGGGEVDRVVAAHAPGQLEDAVEPGADPALLRRLGAGALEAVDLLGDEVAGAVGGVERLQLRAVLADDVVVALAELLADGRQLLAQQELALLLVDALGDVVADGLGDLQLGEVLAGPRQDELDALADVDGGEHVAAALLGQVGPADDAVGERAGLEPAAQQLGQPARPAQLGDLLEHAAQVAGEGLDARGRARIAQDVGGGVGGAALGAVDGGDPGPRLDAHDGDRLTRREGADVGHLGDDGERAVAGTQQDPAVTALLGGLGGPAGLVGDEGEGDDGTGQHRRWELGEGEADASVRRGGAATRATGSLMASKGIDPVAASRRNCYEVTQVCWRRRVKRPRRPSSRPLRAASGRASRGAGR